MKKALYRRLKIHVCTNFVAEVGFKYE